MKCFTTFLLFLLLPLHDGASTTPAAETSQTTPATQAPLTSTSSTILPSDEVPSDTEIVVSDSSSSPDPEIVTISGKDSDITTTPEPNSTTILPDPIVSFNITEIYLTVDNIMEFNNTLDNLENAIPEPPSKIDPNDIMLDDMYLVTIAKPFKYYIAERTCFRKEMHLFVPRTAEENELVKNITSGTIWARIRRMVDGDLGDQFYTPFTGKSQYSPEQFWYDGGDRSQLLFHELTDTKCVTYNSNTFTFKSQNCRTHEAPFICGMQTNFQDKLDDISAMEKHVDRIRKNYDNLLTNLEFALDELEQRVDSAPRTDELCPEITEVLPEFNILNSSDFNTLRDHADDFLGRARFFLLNLKQRAIQIDDHVHAVDKRDMLCLDRNAKEEIILVQDGKPIEIGNNTVIMVKSKEKIFWDFSIIDLVLSIVSLLLTIITIFSCIAKYCPQVVPFLRPSQRQPTNNNAENEPLNSMQMRQVRFVEAQPSAPPAYFSRRSSSSSSSSSGAPEDRYL